jgi:hypothetical protein
MIESLAEHGVIAEDLVPALRATHTVKNPEYDPKAAKEVEQQGENQGDWDNCSEHDAPPPYEQNSTLPDMPSARSSTPPAIVQAGETTPTKSTTPLPALRTRPIPINPFGDDDDDEEDVPVTAKPIPRISSPPVSAVASSSTLSPLPRKKSTNPFGSDDEDDGLPSFASSSRPSYASPSRSSSRTPSFDIEDDEGDIGRPTSPVRKQDRDTNDIATVTTPDVEATPHDVVDRKEEDQERTPRKEHFSLPDEAQRPAGEQEEEEEPASLPSLPGVSTSLTNADENVVLDIRWTVVSD